MPGEDVTRILRSKTDLTELQIATMSRREAWALVYSLKKKASPSLPKVCFTGFGMTERSTMELRTRQSGRFSVAQSVTKDLEFLCAGENAGEKKLEKAKAQGVMVISRDDFDALVTDGVVPQR